MYLFGGKRKVRKSGHRTFGQPSSRESVVDIHSQEGGLRNKSQQKSTEGRLEN
jgi:hypothetical protein